MTESNPDGSKPEGEALDTGEPEQGWIPPLPLTNRPNATGGTQKLNYPCLQLSGIFPHQP